ncbi:hypothetical protein GE061_004323 [Apolygus lucorum]|uniref:Uncharacterized protein n=1 Tax=Apolygus lucorum TaxID=248454 RepID=A0A8S9WYY9_APOLU|nr:hypothetical protein GE061_004323 [Apolygus lucorum]
MLGMCRPAGISLILVLVACQQSASGESGHEWRKQDLDFKGLNVTVKFFKDMPKAEREKWWGYTDKAMKLHDATFNSVLKNRIPQYLYIKYVYNNKNAMADTYKTRFKDVDVLLQKQGNGDAYKLMFKDDKFTCALVFLVKDGAVDIRRPPEITGMCVPVNFGKGEIWGKVVEDVESYKDILLGVLKKALKRSVEKSKHSKQ